MILDKFGDEMEKAFEKRQLLRVTTHFIKNFLKKKTSFVCDNVFS
jgi:hypothetical protein